MIRSGLTWLSFACVTVPATTANTKGHDSPDTRGAFCRCAAKLVNRWVFNEFSHCASIATTAKPASPRQATRAPCRLCSGFGFVGLGPTRYKHRLAVFVSGASGLRLRLAGLVGGSRFGRCRQCSGFRFTGLLRSHVGDSVQALHRIARQIKGLHRLVSVILCLCSLCTVKTLNQ